MADSVIGVFDRVADRYDEVLPFFSTFARELAAVLPFRSGIRVLDLGAGRGAVTAEALARGCQVTAIDAAPKMLARLIAAHGGHSGLEAARLMDARRLDFPAASFDIVTSGFVVRLLDEPAAATREVRRVLVPGGLFAFTVPGLPPGAGLAEQPVPQDPASALFAEFGRYLPAGGGMGRPLDGRALLASAGFTGIGAVAISVDLPVTDGEACWQWSLTHGSIKFLEDLPQERREEFRQRLVAGVDAVGGARLRRTATVWQGHVPPSGLNRRVRVARQPG
jgi:ubiquinone/menaquinone biosynthesis C-methylase UbiE